MTYPRRDRLIFDTPHDARHYDHDPYSSRVTIPVPMPPGADILARRLSDVSEAELKEVLRFTEGGGHKNYYAKPVARLIVELAAKAVLNAHGGRVHASAVDFEQDPVGQYALFNVLFAWYVPESKIKGVSELGSLTRNHPCIWTDLIDIVRIALEKSATPPPKPSRDDEILDRLQQLEGMLQQQQSATLALTTMCGWLLRSIPPSVWESGGAETVRLVGELADAVSPWPDESPAAAEASLRAARSAGTLIEGPGPCMKPSDTVEGLAFTHPQQAPELSQHLPVLAKAADGDSGGDKGPQLTSRWVDLVEGKDFTKALEEAIREGREAAVRIKLILWTEEQDSFAMTKVSELRFDPKTSQVASIKRMVIQTLEDKSGRLARKIRIDFQDVENSTNLSSFQRSSALTWRGGSFT